MQQEPSQTGVLLVNLGTPDTPDSQATRRYLGEFLADPRVVDLHPLLWRPILHGVILRIRPRFSAENYCKIWTQEGSPLLAISRQQLKALRQVFEDQNQPLHLELAMRYGQPSIKEGLEQLLAKKIDRLLVLPLYPQYSATTTASCFDALAKALKKEPRLPEILFLRSYAQDPGYIQALANSVREHQTEHGVPDKLLISFHGIPQRYVNQGDPYADECQATAHLLANTLGLAPEQWQLGYQSRFGREPWLKPYVDQTLKDWGRQGIKKVQVLCPGFSADCLETLEEIAMQNRDVFLKAGGQDYGYIPALNTRPDHIQALAALIRDKLGTSAQTP